MGCSGARRRVSRWTRRDRLLVDTRRLAPRRGRPKSPGPGEPRGDDLFPYILGSLLIPVLGWSIGSRILGRASRFFLAGAAVTWNVMYLWRGSVAEVSGGNLVLVGVVGFTVPLGVALWFSAKKLDGPTPPRSQVRQGADI